jgi:RHS repeat-associated protein
MEKKYSGKTGKGLKLTGKGELFDKDESFWGKLTGSRVIFENNNCAFTTISYGYQSGSLLHITETCGIIQNGIVVGDSVECFQDHLVYLNGLKVGIYLTCAGEEEGSYYFLYDGQGNVAQLSNTVGELPWHLFKYDSFGKTTEHLTSDLQGDSGENLYKGYDSGPFGYKTGVRHYDPETGVFISPDPFKGYMGDPPSQHPYMYCHGNPIAYWDPSGYKITKIEISYSKQTATLYFDNHKPMYLPVTVCSQNTGEDSKIPPGTKMYLSWWEDNFTSTAFTTTKKPWSEDKGNPYGPVAGMLSIDPNKYVNKWDSHIHGTNGEIPKSIYSQSGLSDNGNRAITHGCTRFNNKAIIFIRKEAPLGTKVIFIK